MPDLRAEMGKARRGFDEARELATKLQAEVAVAEMDEGRSKQAYLTARSQEHKARQEARDALGKWLKDFGRDELTEATALSAAYPIVLLPVRIETRFMPVGRPTMLRVRIFPDEIAADTHERELTEQEYAAAKAYWNTAWGRESEEREGEVLDREERGQEANEREREAWRALVRRYPPPRAAWIVRETTPTNLRRRPAGTPDLPNVRRRAVSWTRAAEAGVLPDRWMVIAYRGGQEVHRVLSAPILDPLALSPDPSETDLEIVSGDGLKFDSESVWMVDFARAEKAGMAMTIKPLNRADVQKGFDRVIALGVKASLTPTEAGQRLAALLEGHHYTRGFAFVPQGTPTNNTGDGPAGYPPPDLGGSSSFVMEREERKLTGESDGSRFAAALGLSALLKDELPHLAGADELEQARARLMNEALWPVTLGYFLEQLLTPGFDLDPKALAGTRAYFLSYVRGRGPYPAFRVGATPYGLLPVSSLTRWQATPHAKGPVSSLPAILRPLRDIWLTAARGPAVPRVGRIRDPDDPDADLLDVLSMDASAREVRMRKVWGPDLVANLLHFYGLGFFGVNVGLPGVDAPSWSRWSSRRNEIAQRVVTMLGQMGWPATAGPPRLAGVVFANAAYRFQWPLVTANPLSETDMLEGSASDFPNAKNYIEWVTKAPIDAVGAGLRDQRMDNPPLLYLMLRHAMLLGYGRAALELRIRYGPPPTAADRRDPELVGIPIDDAATVRESVWDHLAAKIPAIRGGATVGDYVFRGGGPGAESVQAYRTVLTGLVDVPTAELDRLFTETLDVCSHRLDAWVTSLATQRLDAMRAKQAEGCHLGAFGWLEDLSPAPADRYKDRTVRGRDVMKVQSTSGGYIQAPSLGHAAAAAVLRNGYLTRAAETKKPFAIDLSSARVRAARWLLDGVRQGQPLGALLGYRFERALHDQQIERYIAPLRERYPLVANKGDPSAAAAAAAEEGTVEVLAARNVVDGLSIWRRGTDAFADLRDPATGRTSTDIDRLELERKSLGQALDGVADLLTAESIYQVIRGNPTTAVASLDAMAQGVRPPDPEIAHTVRGGVTLTHRVMLVLGGTALSAPAGWRTTLTPRAAAEPYLDGWVATLLGDPRSVSCRVSYPDPAPADAARRSEVVVTMDELNLRPLDVLALAAEGSPVSGASELDRRVAVPALEKISLSPAPPLQQLRIAYVPDPTRERPTPRSFSEVLELARVVHGVVGGARALRVEDLVPPEAAEMAEDADEAANVSDASSRADAAKGALGKALSDLDRAIFEVQRALTLLNALDRARAPGASILSDRDHGIAHRPGVPFIDEALRTAALLGVPGAFPAGASSAELLEQARSVREELARRQTRANAASDPTAVAAAIFGGGFVLLRRFTPTADAADELDLALAAGQSLVAQHAHATRKWMEQAARVRAPLTRWRKLGLLARALGASMPELDVAQLPHVDGAQWAALPFAPAEPPPSGRLSLVLQRTAEPSASDPWAGLLLDQWTEIIPSATAQTGIAFHYDDPGAEAAQAVLVAVPPTMSATNWDPTDLVAIVNETLDLAQMRSVSGEDLGELGQLLPAMFVAAYRDDPLMITDLTSPAVTVGERSIGP